MFKIGVSLSFECLGGGPSIYQRFSAHLTSVDLPDLQVRFLFCIKFHFKFKDLRETAERRVETAIGSREPARLVGFALAFFYNCKFALTLASDLFCANLWSHVKCKGWFYPCFLVCFGANYVFTCEMKRDRVLPLFSDLFLFKDFLFTCELKRDRAQSQGKAEEDQRK